MPGQVSRFNIKDVTGETSTFELPNGAITAVSIAGFLTSFGELRTAIDAVTLGTIRKESWVGDDTLLSEDLPASPYAQREIGLRIYMTGNDGSPEFHRTLPCPDLTAVQFTPGAGDFVSITEPQSIADLVAAIEAHGRHPDSDLENITVTKIRVIGRNS